MSSAAHYLKTFFDEKGIDPEETFEFTNDLGVWNLMPYGVVIEAILGAPAAEQAAIAKKIRIIDFKNGDVKDFLRHLGKALGAGKDAP
jgi:hypothetical protein